MSPFCASFNLFISCRFYLATWHSSFFPGVLIRISQRSPNIPSTWWLISDMITLECRNAFFSDDSFISHSSYLIRAKRRPREWAESTSRLFPLIFEMLRFTLYLEDVVSIRRPAYSSHYSRLPRMMFLLAYHVGLAANIFSHMIYERDPRELHHSCDVFVSWFRLRVLLSDSPVSFFFFYDKILSNDPRRERSVRSLSEIINGGVVCLVAYAKLAGKQPVL